MWPTELSDRRVQETAACPSHRRNIGACTLQAAGKAQVVYFVDRLIVIVLVEPIDLFLVFVAERSRQRELQERSSSTYAQKCRGLGHQQGRPPPSLFNLCGVVSDTSGNSVPDTSKRPTPPHRQTGENQQILCRRCSCSEVKSIPMRSPVS